MSVVLRILAVTAAYYASARLGLLLALVNGQVTPLWPPTGIALVCLLLLGVRVWPGIALGAFLVNLPIGPTLPAVLAISAGNTLAPVCAGLLLRRVGFRTELDRLRDTLALVFLGALAGMLVSATIGTGTLQLAGTVAAGRFWSTWSVWWTGDAMGVLAVSPVLLVVRAAWPIRDVRPARWLEAAALALGTLAATVLVTRSSMDLLFGVFPFLVWAALRFEQRGAAPCALLVSVLAVLAAAEPVGPFARHDLLTDMVILQAFNGTAALTALLLAAVTGERNRGRREVERACLQLAGAVDQLALDESTRQSRILNAMLRGRNGTPGRDGEARPAAPGPPTAPGNELRAP